MASLQGLLLFSEFLENRLETTAMELLRRMFRDFSAGNEHTLVDFMRLGAMIVAIFPKERTNPKCLQAAARLLEQQLHTTESVLQQSDIDVFRYLSARVATKNIMWMRDMFYEFCEARDASLREFVRRGNEAISIIPVDIQALCAAPLPPPPLIYTAMMEAEDSAETAAGETHLQQAERSVADEEMAVAAEAVNTYAGEPARVASEEGVEVTASAASDPASLVPPPDDLRKINVNSAGQQMANDN